MTSPLRHKLSKKIGKKPSRYCKIYHTGSKKGHKTSIGRKINKRRLNIIHVNVESSEEDEEVTGDRTQKLIVESDYLLVEVDNNASALMAINIHIFIGTLKPIKNRVVKGCGVVVKVIGEGTVKCKI